MIFHISDYFHLISFLDSAFEVLNDKFCIPGGGRISRADVARYMLQICSDEASYKKIQAITVKT